MPDADVLMIIGALIGALGLLVLLEEIYNPWLGIALVFTWASSLLALASPSWSALWWLGILVLAAPGLSLAISTLAGSVIETIEYRRHAKTVKDAIAAAEAGRPVKAVAAESGLSAEWLRRVRQPSESEGS